jgi:predicted nucleic acid binding AN1-type Zn finger protein
MKILVKTCSGKTIEMSVENPKMSVMGFKRLIAEKECIPPQHQRLIFVAEELDNGKTLEEVANKRRQMAEAASNVDDEAEADAAAGEVELTFHLIASPPPPIPTAATSTSTLPSAISLLASAPATGKRKRTASDVSSSSTEASPKASPSRKLSKKCAFVGCSKRSVVIIGDCKFCNEKFCSSHRLVEDHLCSATASCKQASFDKNASKLLREKCVAQKLRQY